MKNYLFFISFFAFSLLGLPNTIAQFDEGVWISAGISYGNILGKGDKDNVFLPGWGARVEIGFIDDNWGSSIYVISGKQMKNQVAESVINIFYVQQMLMEVRYNFSPLNEKVNPYVSMGLGWGSMKIENTKGWDHQFNIQSGGGLQLLLDNKAIIELYVKPYLVTANQFGQNWGYNCGISIGPFWSAN